MNSRHNNQDPLLRYSDSQFTSQLRNYSVEELRWDYHCSSGHSKALVLTEMKRRGVSIFGLGIRRGGAFVRGMKSHQEFTQESGQSL